MNKHLPIPSVADTQLQNLLAMRRARLTLAVAQEKQFFDLLSGAIFTVATVADVLKMSPRAAKAMVAVLTSLGFVISRDGGFELSEEANTYLVNHSPFCRPPIISPDDDALDIHRKAFEGDQPVQPVAVNIEDLTVERVQGFINHMHLITLPTAATLGQQTVFASMRRLLDVGGGSGSLSIGVASQNDEIQCVLLDVAPVCTIAERNIAEYGLSHRIKTQVGDMFKELPSGFDGVLFGNIFHDWDWESCSQLAKRAYDALSPGGHICLHELILEPDLNGPLAVASMAVAMLVHERGQQFTEPELASLLEAVGFVEVVRRPSFGHYSLVTARKPK